jgi:hypothetical protein
MRLALLLLVACGNRSSDPPSTEQAPQSSPTTEPPAKCSPPGSHVCVGDRIVQCDANGKPGTVLQQCKGKCARGACVETCALRDVELIYTVDAGHYLSSFDPKKLPGDPFHRIGKLTCEPSGQPFSMAVDREGIAWVLYRSGMVYRVSIVDAHCSSGLRVEHYPGLFGMGFASDADKSTETLFVASERDGSLGMLEVTRDPPRFATLSTLSVPRKNNPELTGTGDGKLFGYFPETGRGFVQELDPQTGNGVGERMKVGGDEGDIGGWAFAHWGGVFYVFVTTAGNSAVHAIHRKTGKYELIKDHLPQRIVGAGVSTCAPLLEATPK